MSTYIVAAMPEVTGQQSPVKVFDFKMVGNWVDAADGLEVQGDGSELTFTYLHVADDSMKVAAKKMKYKHTTILQGDVGTGGMINLGSYGTADSQGSNVEGVYVHRITHKPFSCTEASDTAVRRWLLLQPASLAGM